MSSLFPSNWNLPEAILQRLGTRSLGRQRAICEEGHVLLVLHAAPSSGDSERTPVLFWREPSGKWHASARGGGLAALSAHLERYERLEEKLDRELAQASNAHDLFEILEVSSPLQRSARNQYAALQTAREAVRGDRDLIGFRDQAGEIDRACELLYTEARYALDYQIAKRSEEQALADKAQLRTAHRLNVLAALFLPITALSSILGMNLNTGLESSSPIYFWLVLLFGLVFGLFLRSWAGWGISREAASAIEDAR